MADKLTKFGMKAAGGGAKQYTRNGVSAAEFFSRAGALGGSSDVQSTRRAIARASGSIKFHERATKEKKANPTKRKSGGGK